jgi:hypothetical protein
MRTIFDYVAQFFKNHVVSILVYQVISKDRKDCFTPKVNRSILLRY